MIYWMKRLKYIPMEIMMHSSNAYSDTIMIKGEDDVKEI